MKSILLGAGLLALCAHAAASGGSPLTFWAYSAKVDASDQTATFTIRFKAVPDLYTTDPNGQIKDSFAFWVDPDAPNAYDRAFDHLIGDLPNSKQTFIASSTIADVGQLQTSWVQDSTTYPGPWGANGWGSVEGYVGYTLTGRTLSFDVPLSMLQDTDGRFYYSLMVLRYGAAEGNVLYDGVSGITYRAPFPVPSPVPEPASWLLLAGGGLMLAGVGRRSALRGQTPGTQP